MSAPKEQTMKPQTAARKLGVLLEATPEEFRGRDISRDELNELQSNPPAWLTELRRNGPHPRQEVARRLRVSTSGLARGGVTEPLTTVQIKALLEEMPAWLESERATAERVRAEEARLRGRADEQPSD
ncbi:hypothetical protein KZX45_17525 [Georgenia sp. EYE_87]|uniref:DUF5997 family protein n=1 Tax=Georgenia sp. EYE_87 TaxID=2853448 RepID=UPI00200526C4|nr:DUF5997 family protein [Georgenia sp. EYE_87]MCK6212346.1 hypothetical protein [Georgenia sp. EYE_87]